MTETKDQILDRMREAMPFYLPERIRPYIEEAMQIYADQQLRLHVVSQHRELLLAFWNYAFENDLENVVRPMSEDVDEFLANYSG